MLSAYAGHVKLVHGLIHHGADPDRLNDLGQAPSSNTRMKSCVCSWRRVLILGRESRVRILLIQKGAVKLLRHASLSLHGKCLLSRFGRKSVCLDSHDGVHVWPYGPAWRVGHSQGKINKSAIFLNIV